MPRSAKPLKGFGGASVLEIVARDEAGTYRGVYTVKFSGVVYVLHVFQKKSTFGIATPKHELDLIKSRLNEAKAHHQRHRHELENDKSRQES
jgi:phage-related protein